MARNNIDTTGGITIVQSKFISNSQVQFQFDAVTLEEHTSELDITQEPVEAGTIITDHAIIIPKQYTLSGAVSDIKTSSGIPRGGVEASLNTRASYEQLIRLQQSREPFDIVTKLFVYRNFLITSISASQDKDTANILLFQADMQQIQISETQSVPLPREKIDPSTNDRGPSPDSQGTKSPDEQGPVTPENNQNWWTKLTGGTSEFFRRG